MKKNDPLAARRGPADCRGCGVRESALFADLRPEDLALIHLPIDEMSYAPGGALYHIGDPATAVFAVRNGLVKLEQYLPNGGRRIVRLLRSGDVAGLEALMGQPYAHAAVALRTTQVCRIPKPVIDRLSQETPRLQSQLLRRWSQAVERADAFLVELSAGSARARVARLFLLLAENPDESPGGKNGDNENGGDENNGAALCELFGREDVGAALGITTETASRMVADFKRRKWVEETQPNLFRCDLAALRAIADEG